MLENLSRCIYQIRFMEPQLNPHFACEEEAAEESSFCIFHDRENYEKFEPQAADRFRKKVSERDSLVRIPPTTPIESEYNKEWAEGDSNPRSPPCQGGILTRLDHRPDI